MAGGDQTIFKQRAQTYLDVNAFDLVALKDNLKKPGNETFADAFKSDLEVSISGEGLSQAEYEELTGDEFEDHAGYVAFLTAMHAFIFENGPHP